MKEQYEAIEIDIKVIPENDVITTSSPAQVPKHENTFVNWDDFE